MRHPAGMAVSLGRVRADASKQWIIFYYSTMKPIAQTVKEHLGSQAELSDLSWDRFSDGFPNLALTKHDVACVEEYYGTCLILSFHSQEVIFEQLALLYALP